MDLTQGTAKQKHARARKMMLYFGMASLIMGFAGWTSAYIVSRSREDWLSEIQLPSSFWISTALLLLSSVSYILAKRAIQNDKKILCTTMLRVTLGLGIAFIFMQFRGFDQMLANGYYFTGETSSIKMSYVYLIAAVHIAHVVAGLISLIVVLYQQSKGKYSAEEHLGLTLGATFWHFLDLLWVYLMLFMTFVK